MKSAIILALATILGIAGGVALVGSIDTGHAAPVVEKSPDFDWLQGSWRITSAELGGEPFAAFQNSRFVVAGHEFKQFLRAGDVTAEFTLDPGKSPKWVDVSYTAGPDKGRRRPGIYQIEGDTMKACLGVLDSKDRPQCWECKAKPGFIYLVARRETK